MRRRFITSLILPLVAFMSACSAITPTQDDDDKEQEEQEEENPPIPSIIDVTGISLDASTLNLVVGDTYQLTVSVLPANATNKSFSISSRNPSIASVSVDGLVTAKSTGTATLVATSMEGFYNTYCTVYVKDKEVTPSTIKVTGVSVSPECLTLKEGETADLNYTITPDNATNKAVSWTIVDSTVANISSGHITAKKEGNTDINVITSDGNYSATCHLTVTKDEEESGGEEYPQINYVKVFADKSDYEYVYTWIKDGGSEIKPTGSWPGTKMRSYDSDWLVYDFDPQYTSFNIIFNKGNSQTDDLYIPRVGYYWCYHGRLYNKLPSEEDETTDLPQGNYELVTSAKDYTELPAVKNYSKGMVVNPYTGARTDFRQESIYFAMTTRFYDGDSSNNQFCWDNKNKSDPEWKGDFKGLIEKMDYIKALGFTAIWITPVVKNASGYDYHGYHAINFGEVDPRYESTDVKFSNVIKEAHKRDMKIVLDVVFNHTSNNGEENLFPMFTYNSKGGTQSDLKPGLYYSSVLPQNYASMDGGQKFQARIQAMKTSKDGYNIYHHEMNMGYEQYIEQTGSLAGDCIDLNTENPTVANYLVDRFGDFIRMGVDAFRVDTVKHISRLTFNKYLIPGLYAIANKCGNNNFFMFGEVCNRDRGVWNHNVAADSACFYTWKESKEYAWGDRKTNEKSTLDNWNDNVSPDGQPTSNNVYLGNNYTYHTPDHSKNSGLGVIDFGMHWNFRYASDAYNVAKNNDQVYNDASYNVVYVDSHDYGPDGIDSIRYNEGTSAWKENMSLMFTFRGVPCIYYGSEVEFMAGKKIDQYQNLSNSGRAYYGDYLTGTVNATDFGVYTASGTVKNTLDSTLSQHLMMLNKIRQKVPALSMGQYSAQSSSMAYVRRYTKGNIDSLAVVAVSSGASFSGLPAGTYVDLVSGDRKTVSNGSLNISLNSKGSVAVYVLENSYTGTLTKIS